MSMMMMRIWVMLFCSAIVSTLPTPQKVGRVYKASDSLVIIEGPDGSVIKADTTGGSVSIGVSVPPVVIAPAPTEDPESNEGSTDEGAEPTEDESDSGKEPTTPPSQEPSTASSQEPSTASSQEPSTAPSEEPSTAQSQEPSTAPTGNPSSPPVDSTPGIDVEIIEPVTLPPPPPPEGEVVDLAGPSGRISISGSRIIVAGPASVLVKEPGRVVKVNEPAKEKEAIKTTQKRLSVKQPKLVQLLPNYYEGLVIHPEWANLIAPGLPVIIDPIRPVRAT